MQDSTSTPGRWNYSASRRPTRYWEDLDHSALGHTGAWPFLVRWLAQFVAFSRGCRLTQRLNRQCERCDAPELWRFCWELQREVPAPAPWETCSGCPLSFVGPLPPDYSLAAAFAPHAPGAVVRRMTEEELAGSVETAKRARQRRLDDDMASYVDRQMGAPEKQPRKPSKRKRLQAQRRRKGVVYMTRLW